MRDLLLFRKTYFFKKSLIRKPLRSYSPESLIAEMKSLDLCLCFMIPSGERQRKKSHNVCCLKMDTLCYLKTHIWSYQLKASLNILNANNTNLRRMKPEVLLPISKVSAELMISKLLDSLHSFSSHRR